MSIISFPKYGLYNVFVSFYIVSDTFLEVIDHSIANATISMAY